MTAWLEQLQPASFRDVPFQVDSIEVQAGENLVLREYPFQDLPGVFRMGLAAEEIRFSAYVIGPDYQAKRDALRAVLVNVPREGGVLVHPTAGAMRAHVAGKFTIKEAPVSEGCVVRFDIAFVRAEVFQYPKPTASTTAAAMAAGDAAKAAAEDEFAAGFGLGGAPGWVQERVVDRVKASLDVAWSGLKTVTAGLGDFTDQTIGTYQVLSSGLNDLVRDPRALGGMLSELMTLPVDLNAATSASFQSAFEGLFNLGSSLPNNAFEARVVPPEGEGLVMLGLGDPDLLSADTSAQRSLATLQGQADQLFSTLATAAWVQAVAATELTGYDQALRLRSRIYQQCQALLLRSSTSAAPRSLPTEHWHAAVAGLMGAALTDLQARSRDLARLTTYTPQATLSIWTISHRLYGTAEWADEIWAMNPHIEHPMLVPPGRPLRVVRHD